MFDGPLGHYLTYHHASQDFFRRHRDKFDGLIIPLSVATFFKQGTGGFVLTLKMPYAVDPRTPIFQADFNRSSVRGAHLEMAAVHGPTVQRVFPQRPLRPSDFDRAAVSEVAGGVVAFQKEFSQTAAAKVAKYAELLGEDVEDSYSSPQFLIAPYFRAESRRDEWYRVSLDLARAAANEKTKFALAPVIHVTKEFPESHFPLLGRDYADGGFDGLIVFVNDLNEYIVPQQVLTKYINLVAVLRDLGKPLFGLFGGYFTLLLRKIGLPCFGNAVGYGENRDSGYHQGGQAIRRYYIPKLHRYYTDTSAQTILDMVGGHSLHCQCQPCLQTRRVTDLTSQELLDHFLNARLIELQGCKVASLGSLLDELDEAYSMLRSTGLPPDQYGHLHEWTSALRPLCA